MITVVRAGPLTTVQDLGRPGWAHLGVPRSGALDPAALRHANRLVGNPPDAAGLETTLLGCAVRCERATTIAVTGAPARIRLDGAGAPHGAPIAVPAGATVDVGRATAGLRSYVAVAGGIDVQPVLGSRATDTLSGLGPATLSTGDTLPVGTAASGVRTPAGEAPVGEAPVGEAPAEKPPDGGLVLRVRLGPRDDWFGVDAVRLLLGSAYTVSPMSNRIGARLAGPALPRSVAGELESEGVVLGAVQVPSDGQPLIFLADHPTTGGYPVIGVVDDVTPLAQARPGATVYFRDHD
jgi:biotin-dependent carboxylase-like uncharacterized protein